LLHAVLQSTPVTSLQLERFLTCARHALLEIALRPLTLEQIGSFLAECGVQFVGFELDLQVLQQYRACFTDDPSATDLRNWARFEADHPTTFAQMYRFWIQQPATPGKRA
jgi:hypothetical protein